MERSSPTHPLCLARFRRADYPAASHGVLEGTRTGPSRTIIRYPQCAGAFTHRPDGSPFRNEPGSAILRDWLRLSIRSRYRTHTGPSRIRRCRVRPFGRKHRRHGRPSGCECPGSSGSWRSGRTLRLEPTPCVREVVDFNRFCDQRNRRADCRRIVDRYRPISKRAAVELHWSAFGKRPAPAARR